MTLQTNRPVDTLEVGKTYLIYVRKRNGEGRTLKLGRDGDLVNLRIYALMFEMTSESTVRAMHEQLQHLRRDNPGYRFWVKPTR